MSPGRRRNEGGGSFPVFFFASLVRITCAASPVIAG